MRIYLQMLKKKLSIHKKNRILLKYLKI